MRMVRRRYEEDSSVEGFEDYPLYRTVRLHGGHGPAGAQANVARSVETTSDSNDNWPQHFGQHQYSTNNSVGEDRVNFMTELCDSHHLFERTSGWRLPHRCRACNSGRTMTLVQCTQCKMYVHPECKEVTNNKTPLPCIPATPIRDVMRPDLRQCLACLPRDCPKVPAILTKCFHELQKRDRIIKPDIYVPLSSKTDKELAEVKKMSVKLRRHVNRTLDKVPTHVVSGCVLHFLSDIRDQLFTPEENQEFRNFQLRFYGWEEKEVPEEAGNFLRKLDKYRLQTLAVVFMHIRNVYAYREENNFNTQRVYDVFGEVFVNVRILFNIPPSFWLCFISKSFRRGQLPKMDAPTRSEIRLLDDED